MQIDSIRYLGAAALTPASSSAVPAERESREPEMIPAVRAVNESGFFGLGYELTFSMDAKSRRMLLRLVDKETKEVVRQIPPEYVLRLARELRRT